MTLEKIAYFNYSLLTLQSKYIQHNYWLKCKNIRITVASSRLADKIGALFNRQERVCKIQNYPPQITY